jgi:hypothetical protein
MKTEKARRGSFPISSFVVKSSEAERGEEILTVSSLRDVLGMKVSPTAVFHFVMSSSSDIGSLYEYQPETKLGSNGGKKKGLETNLVLTQNTQADLTHHLFNVHLPPLVRIVDLSKPTHRLQRRTSCSNSRDRDSPRTEAAL